MTTPDVATGNRHATTRRIVVVVEPEGAGWRARAQTSEAGSQSDAWIDPGAAAVDAVDRLMAHLARCRCAVAEGVLRVHPDCPKHGAR